MAIQRAAEAAGKTVRRVLIGGPVNRVELAGLITQAIAVNNPAVHLDVHETSQEDLDCILMDLLVVGRLYCPITQKTVVVPPDAPIYVEVAT